MVCCVCSDRDYDVIVKVVLRGDIAGKTQLLERFGMLAPVAAPKGVSTPYLRCHRLLAL